VLHISDFPPAILNAIYNATGVRINKLPVGSGGRRKKRSILPNTRGVPDGPPRVFSFLRDQRFPPSFFKSKLFTFLVKFDLLA
jgi:hypothetical protein